MTTSNAVSDHAKLIGQIAILMNTLQSIVNAIYITVIGTDFEVAQAVFFSVKSDAGQRDLTMAAVRARLKLPEEEELLKEISAAISKMGVHIWRT